MDLLLAAPLLPGTCILYGADFTQRTTISVTAGTSFIFYVQCQLSSWEPEDTRVVIKTVIVNDEPAPYPFHTLTAKLKHTACGVLTFTGMFKDPGVYPIVLYIGSSLHVKSVFIVQ